MLLLTTLPFYHYPHPLTLIPSLEDRGKTKGIWYEAELSYLNTPIIGKRLPNAQRPHHESGHLPAGTMGRRLQI